MKLKTRLFVLLTLLALIPLGLALGWQAFDRAADRRTVEEYHLVVADFVASGVADWKAQQNKRMSFLYDLERSSGRDLNINAFKLFQQVTAPGSDILSAALVAPDGTAPISLQADSTGAADDPAGDPLVAAVRKSRAAAFGPLKLAGGEPGVAFAYPLPDGHVVRLLLSLRDVWKRTANRKLGATGRVLLLDGEGLPLPGQELAQEAVPLKKDVFGLDKDSGAAAAVRVAPEELEPAAVKAALAAGPRGFAPRLAGRSGRLTASWIRLDAFPWTVLTVQRRSEAFRAEEKSLLGLILFVTISLILGLATATVIARRVSIPVLSLVDAARRVAAHDYGRPLEVEGWPEFVTLAATFNEMTAQLKSFADMQVGKILAEKAKAETLVRTIPDGVLMADARGGVLYGNPQGLKLLGMPDKPAPGLNMLASVPSGPLRAALEKALKSEGAARADARVTVSKDPFMEKVYRVYSSPFALADAKQHGRIMLLRDVTSEAAMESMKNEQFLMIAHDMRGSLTVIEGGADLVSRMPGLPEKALKYAKAIRASGRTLTGMVSDILNLNKMEAGQMELRPAPFSINAMLAAQREAHQIPAEGRKVTLADVPLAEDVLLVGDRPLLERVIANLVVNALKFTPSGGHIEVTCPRVDARQLCLCVADNGPGIPADKKNFIFEKYGQLEEGKSQGFGLGLAMCKMAVELHGGRIWVESELGHGSRFLFTLSRELKPAA